MIESALRYHDELYLVRIDLEPGTHTYRELMLNLRAYCEHKGQFLPVTFCTPKDKEDFVNAWLDRRNHNESYAD